MRKTLIADHPLHYGRRIAVGEEFTATEPHARVWIGLRKAHLKPEGAPSPTAEPAVQVRNLQAEPPSTVGTDAAVDAPRRRRTYRRRDIQPGETK